MKKYVLMHIGFEQPTPEIMEQWNAWFQSIVDQTVENIGFNGGFEISNDNEKELGWDGESITGYSIIEAENMEAAKRIAQANPFVSSIRVYEVRDHQGASS